MVYVGDIDILHEDNDLVLSLLRKEENEAISYILNKNVPFFYSVFRFMVHLYEQTRYSKECNIIALIYINRITTSNKMALTASNWRICWIVSIMVAQKVWSSKPLRSGNFSKIYPDIRKTFLKRAESSFVSLMQFNTRICPSLYARYYLDLNQLYKHLAEIYKIEDISNLHDWEPITQFTRSLLSHKFEKISAKEKGI